ncbi:MAG: glycosyltransferase [Candidatus Omnitrophica bacterium]|nr:glycosyltransferase [Candidatus Omnitrophota bacterium]MDD4012788.1 glycosyltransferase [Candidatus Omnitrophota bacterium]
MKIQNLNDPRKVAHVELSVVILCYKAGARAYDFTSKVMKMLDMFVPSWEMVLVGNFWEGTNDPTPEVVKDIASKRDNIKYVAVPKKGMMGWDARSGLEMASGEYICLIDGDEQMPHRDIVRVYRRIKREHLDFVKTYRLVRHDGLFRILISFFYNVIFFVLFPGILYRDVNSKPKIFKQEAYERMRLESDDWFLDAEIMIQVRRLKFKVASIPSKFYKCNYRNSFVGFCTIFEFIRNLLRARIREFFV